MLVRDGVEVRRSSEIQAAISGLLAVKEYKVECGKDEDKGPSEDDQVILVSDSQLVLRYATGEYRCKAMHLVPFYIQLRKVFKETGATTRWVKGHSGDEFNEICDKLAKSAKEAM